jgi:DNA-binding MarR family transcriptional regulator
MSSGTESLSTPPPTPLHLDAQFCFPVYAANNLIQRAYRPLLAPLGLTYPQYLVLMVLWENDGAGRGVSVSSLGERLFLDSGTLSPLLQRLEAKRLVKKRPDSDDARRVVIGLSAKGRGLRAAAQQIPEALVCRLLPAGVDPTTLAGLEATRAQLRNLAQTLDGLSPEAASAPSMSAASRRKTSAASRR